MKLFGAKKAAETVAVSPAASAHRDVRNVVVFDGSAVHDWPALFESLGPLPDGSKARATVILVVCR